MKLDKMVFYAEAAQRQEVCYYHHTLRDVVLTEKKTKAIFFPKKDMVLIGDIIGPKMLEAGKDYELEWGREMLVRLYEDGVSILLIPVNIEAKFGLIDRNPEKKYRLVIEDSGGQTLPLA